MAPNQPTGTENQDSETQLTDEQIMDLVKSRGITITPEETLDEAGKVSAVKEALGGLQLPDGLSDEEKQQAEEAFDKDTKIAVYEAEKQIGTEFPEISEAKKFEIAKTFLKGDLLGVLKLGREAVKKEAESDGKKSKDEENLHVEQESTGGGKQAEQRITNLDDVFSSGGMLSRVKSFGT